MGLEIMEIEHYILVCMRLFDKLFKTLFYLLKKHIFAPLKNNFSEQHCKHKAITIG
jgi:hypothetical protein